MADETINHEITTVKRKSKDSVFITLFEDKNNILQLYKELHPEDTAVTADDIVVQTLKAVLVNTIYNDLGFLVNEGETPKYILLVEAQSAWNPNMTLRILLYLAETLRQFLKQSGQSLHSDKRVTLPKIELYIVYTGDKNAPDEVSFRDDYFNGDSPIDLKVKILHRTDTTIYGQYIGFCKVYNEQHKLYGNHMKCIDEAIRICIEKGYLAEFLEKHRKEVVTMLAELFDEQAQRDDYNLARDKAMKAEGKAEKAIQVALKLLARGKETLEEIAEDSGLSIEEVRQLSSQI